MDNIKKLTIGCLTAAVLALGCGVTDEGGWSPYPPPSSSQGGLPTAPVGEIEPGTNISTPAPVADRIAMITCEVPPAVELSVQTGVDLPLYAGTRDSVCVGEQGAEASSAFCWEVKAFEGRAAALASCYASAAEELDRQGSRIMGREWLPAALPLLPATWAKSAAEVNALATRVSEGMVHLMTRGAAKEAPGAPLCFPRADGQSAAQAADLALKDIQKLAAATTAELGNVLLALKKGVDVKVNADLRLSVSVQFIVRQPNTEEIGACMFHSSK